MKLSTRHRIVQIILGAMIVVGFVFVGLGFYKNKDHFLHRFDQVLYDFRLKFVLKNHVYVPEADPKIIIVDVDDASIKQEGQWPWPRTVLGDLIKNISADGAAVIALSIVSSEPEKNVAALLSKRLSRVQESQWPLSLRGSTLTSLHTLLDSSSFQESIGSDQLYAKQLAEASKNKNGSVAMVLGYLLSDHGDSVGALPSPLSLDKSQNVSSLMLPNYPVYISNLPEIKNAVASPDGFSSGGFLTTSPDNDGTIRQMPLLIEHDGQLYPSLAFEAVRAYFNIHPTLETIRIGKNDYLNGIRLGPSSVLHTDYLGRVYVPYQGPAGTFQSISATDVLHGHFKPNFFDGAIVFIGSTASALGDMTSTSVGSVFPGIEIHATVADSLSKMINQEKMTYGFPYRPTQAPTLELYVTVALGFVLVLLMPFLNIYWLSVLTITSVLGLMTSDFILFRRYGLVFSIIIPLLMTASLFIFHMAYGFLFERRGQQRIKKMFGEYVPPEYVKRMAENPGSYGFDGESREMSVLFSDIRNFTTVSESLTADQLKKLLNEYLTPMTKIIFDHGGTIDKYVGDMIVAFWGAPIPQHDHAYRALTTGLAMRAELERLTEVFKSEGLPTFNIGVGINTGIMNVGDMGSEYRKAYTVLGDAVNLGSRLESLTKTYHVYIIVSEFVRESVLKTHPEFMFRFLDSVTVKGKTKPVMIYQPLGLRSELEASVLEALALYEQAIVFYNDKRWDDAEKLFQHLNEARPEELYKIYLGRISSEKGGA